MQASFALGQPVLLLVAIALLAASGALLRNDSERRAGHADLTAEAESASPWFRAVLIVCGALVIGSFLTSLDTPVSQLLMLAIALGLAWRSGRLFYLGLKARMPENHWRSCRLLRRIGMIATIVLVARPGCTWSETTWQKPLLVALIDQSRSMSIRDAKDGASRAEAANAALRDAIGDGVALEERFETQLVGFGRSMRSLHGWQSQPTDDVSAIAAALRHAAQIRSTSGDPPQAVILISDGAETASDPQLIHPIAEDYARRRMALHALSAGSADPQASGFTLDPLRVPRKVGLRERIQLSLAGKIETGAKGPVSLAIHWNGDSAETTRVAVESGAGRWQHESTCQPPGPGLQRLTVSASVESPNGTQSVERSEVVDVREEAAKVLFVDDTLRTETAFAARALRSDPAFEVAQRVLSRNVAADDLPRWREFDLIVLGSLAQRRIEPAAFAELAKAVQEGGVGLLIAGGDSLLGIPALDRSDLAKVTPVDLSLSEGIDPIVQGADLTDEGKRHPMFAAVSGFSASGRRFPDLTLNARLGSPKPLAQSLLMIADQSPILVVQEVGRGRSAIAAWSCTWPMALESDAGLAFHRTLWRQMARWLVNRRPAAWVVTDRTDYAAPSLNAESNIHIRAGVSSDNAQAIARLSAGSAALLRMRRLSDTGSSQPSVAGDWVKLPLSRVDGEWRISLNARNWPAGSVLPGDYVIEFTVSDLEARSAGDKTAGALVAQTRFRVVGIDPELREPTVNLAAMKEAAAMSAGGSYRPVEEAKATFEQLLSTDTRRRIERPARWDLAERLAWFMLLVASSAFGGEWLLRKQAGQR